MQASEHRPEQEPLQLAEQEPEHDPLHVFVQRPVQFPTHDPEQLPLHEVPQPPHWRLQPEGSGISTARETTGRWAKITVPNIGSSFCVAFLKNSRRDWSSSLFIFLSMVKKFLN